MTESIQGIVIPPKVSRTTLGMILFHLSKTMAMIGGLLFILLIVMSCYSLIERKFGGTGVIGDIEMMQMGCAVASSLFLPFCTLMAEHLKVDFFTLKLPAYWRNKLDALADFALLFVAILLVCRIGLQTLDMHEYGEVSTLLSWPTWIPNLLILPGFLVMGCCSLYYCIINLTARD